MKGDIWDVPQYPQSDFPSVAVDVWREAESLLGGYPFKSRDACQLAKVPFQPGWLNAETGRLANELGVPVGQAVNAVLLGRRSA